MYKQLDKVGFIPNMQVWFNILFVCLLDCLLALNIIYILRGIMYRIKCTISMWGGRGIKRELWKKCASSGVFGLHTLIWLSHPGSFCGRGENSGKIQFLAGDTGPNIPAGRRTEKAGGRRPRSPRKQRALRAGCAHAAQASKATLRSSAHRCSAPQARRS